MVDFWIFWILDVVFSGLLFFNGEVETGCKECVISFLEPQNEAASVPDEVPDVRGIGAKAILGNDDL